MGGSHDSNDILQNGLKITNTITNESTINGTPHRVKDVATKVEVMQHYWVLYCNTWTIGHAEGGDSGQGRGRPKTTRLTLAAAAALSSTAPYLAPLAAALRRGMVAQEEDEGSTDTQGIDRQARRCGKRGELGEREK